MKILFYSARPFEKVFLAQANHYGYLLSFTPERLTASSVELARDYDAVCLFTNDDASGNILYELQQLGVRMIAIRAAGYDQVDLRKASEYGIVVARVPSYSPESIAEHALLLMLALSRKLKVAHKQMMFHDFTTDHLVGSGLRGKTVGILGTGHTGTTLAKMLRGLGCTVIASDPYPNQELAGKWAVTYVDTVSLCQQADIISLHLPLTSATRHLLNAALFQQMKKGVMLINTARGACVDTPDLLAALDSGQVGSYGADVYEGEKGVFFYDLSKKPFHDPLLENLLRRDNVWITPHQGFATREALENIAHTTLYNIHCWATQEISGNELAVGHPETHLLL